MNTFDISIVYCLVLLVISLVVFLSIFIPIVVRRKHKAKDSIQTSPIIQFGSLTTLKEIKQINVRFDFSQSIIKGLLEDDFLRGQCLISKIGEGWKEHWKTTCYKQFLGKFCIKANSITRAIGLSLGEFPEARYTALFQVQSIDDNGSTSGLMIIKDNVCDKEIVIIDRLYGQGGKFGTFENLISDAMERLGTQFGDFIVKHA